MAGWMVLQNAEAPVSKLHYDGIESRNVKALKPRRHPETFIPHLRLFVWVELIAVAGGMM